MRGLARPLCGAFAFGIGCAAVWVYGRSTLEQSGGMSEGLSAGAWIALGLGGAGATLASRWLADRSIPAAWSLTTLATAAATALLGTAPGSLLLAYAAAALFGLAYTAATSVLILWASTSGTGSAAGTSALFTSLVLGQAAGAPLTGFLLQSGDATLAFPVAALACAVSAAAVAPVGARVRLRWQWCRGRTGSPGTATTAGRPRRRVSRR